MYCNNCGGKGHVFKTCRDPILSCGLILVDIPSIPVPSETAQLLMIRRKDSMSLTELIRGKYDPSNTDYVARLFQNMTLKEQACFVSESYDTLWHSLWGDDRASGDYITGRDKFNRLDRAKLMRENVSPYTESEWGFPKGRRMRGELDSSCAVREFEEETNIPRGAYIVLKNILLEETFMGMNGVQYKHIYYVALLQHPELLDLSQRFTHLQRREISGIGWKSFAEANKYIRPHHVERESMLRQLQDILETFTNET